MQAELQTALFHAFDTLNLQQMKSFNVPPVTLLCGPGSRWRPAVRKRSPGALGICLSWLTVFSIRRE